MTDQRGSAAYRLRAAANLRPPLPDRDRDEQALARVEAL